MAGADGRCSCRQQAVTEKGALKPLLRKQFRYNAAITLQWVLFGSAGQWEHPAEGQLKGFNTCNGVLGFQLKCMASTYWLQPQLPFLDTRVHECTLRCGSTPVQARQLLRMLGQMSGLFGRQCQKHPASCLPAPVWQARQALFLAQLAQDGRTGAAIRVPGWQCMQHPDWALHAEARPCRCTAFTCSSWHDTFLALKFQAKPERCPSVHRARLVYAVRIRAPKCQIDTPDRIPIGLIPVE